MTVVIKKTEFKSLVKRWLGQSSFKHKEKNKFKEKVS